MIDDVIAWHMTSFVQKKKREKDVVDDWFTSHQSYYCLYYNGIPEFF